MVISVFSCRYVFVWYALTLCVGISRERVIKPIKIYGHCEPKQKLLLMVSRCHIFGRRSYKVILNIINVPECWLRLFWISQSLVAYLLLNKWLWSTNQGQWLLPFEEFRGIVLPLPTHCTMSVYLDCPSKGRSMLWVMRTVWGSVQPGRILCAIFSFLLNERSQAQFWLT